MVVLLSKPRFDDEFGGTYILIEPGSFKMGDTVGDGLPRENPIHEVVISSPFLLDKDRLLKCIGKL